jgi:hypothetical protein
MQDVANSELNHSTPLTRIDGTLATVSTVFTTVGQAYRPAPAGTGCR